MRSYGMWVQSGSRKPAATMTRTKHCQLPTIIADQQASSVNDSRPEPSFQPNVGDERSLEVSQCGRLRLAGKPCPLRGRTALQAHVCFSGEGSTVRDKESGGLHTIDPRVIEQLDMVLARVDLSHFLSQRHVVHFSRTTVMAAVMTTIAGTPIATSAPATTSRTMVRTVSTRDASVVISEANTGDTIISTILDSFLSAVYSVEFSYSAGGFCVYSTFEPCYSSTTLLATTLTTRSELTAEGYLTSISTLVVSATATSAAASTTSSAFANDTAGNVAITAVAGAVGGCSVFFIGVGAVILFCVLRRGRRRRRRRMEPSDGMSDMTAPADHATEATTPRQTELDGTVQFEVSAEKQVPPDQIAEIPNTKPTMPGWTSPHTELQTDHTPHELDASPTSPSVGGPVQHMSLSHLSRSLSDPTMGGHSPRQWREQP